MYHKQAEKKAPKISRRDKEMGRIKKVITILRIPIEIST